MTATMLINLCILGSLFGLLILTTSVYSQKYSFTNKDYFLIKEENTFDDAVALCKSRGLNMVSIKRRAENEFIWKTIVKPAGESIWLGANNIIGTKTFKWLADGGDVKTHFTNWARSRPSLNINQRNGIFMYKSDGTWADTTVRYQPYVLCERNNELTEQSKSTENSEQMNAKIRQFDEQLKLTISTQRKEYIELIMEVKEDYNRVHDKLASLIQANSNGKSDNLVAQKDINRKLESQANDMATEIEFQKKHCSQLVSKLDTDVQLKLKQQTQDIESRLNSNERASHERIESLKNDNDLLERRLNRLEQKMTSNIVDNSNKI